MAQCTIPGCERLGGYAGGICGSHRNRLIKYGDPLAGPEIKRVAPRDGTPEAVFKFYMGDVVPSPDQCLVWRGTINKYSGYGAVFNRGRNCGAHRFIYELFKGPIPDGLFVRHTCDNRPCVNPHHLVVGSHQDNMDDRQERGRTAVGNSFPIARLTPATVRIIRKWAEEGITHAEIAKRLSVHRSVVTSVVARKSWKHVA